jgi:hypothetical protein
MEVVYFFTNVKTYNTCNASCLMFRTFEYSLELNTSFTPELVLVNPELMSHVIGQPHDLVLSSYVLG